MLTLWLPINKSDWSLNTNRIFFCRSNISQLFQFSLTANQISGLRFRIFPKQRTRQRPWFKFNPNQSLSQISGLRFLPIQSYTHCELIFLTGDLVKYSLIHFKNIFVWFILDPLPYFHVRIKKSKLFSSSWSRILF